MNEHVALTTVTAELDAETTTRLARVAARHGLSAEAFAAEAIRRQVDEDDAIAEMQADPDFEASVQAGIDDIAAGRFVSHDEAMAKLERMRVKYADRCRE